MIHIHVCVYVYTDTHNICIYIYIHISGQALAPGFFRPDITVSKKHGLGPAKTRPPAPPGAYVGILARFAPPLASLGLPWSSPWLPLASPWPPFGCPLAPLGVPLASLWPPLAPPWRTCWRHFSVADQRPSSKKQRIGKDLGFSTHRCVTEVK